MKFWNLLLSHYQDIKVLFFRFLVVFGVRSSAVCAARWWNTLSSGTYLRSSDQEIDCADIGISVPSAKLI